MSRPILLLSLCVLLAILTFTSAAQVNLRQRRQLGGLLSGLLGGGFGNQYGGYGDYDNYGYGAGDYGYGGFNQGYGGGYGFGGGSHERFY
ncbi:hypothetical protein DAPPUDRAFT_325157 [Daphnia pulex]|uniref:Uncharacterized protein n=1 Tax=Daphnia pulex TaxID=6669 RepID=E9H3W0_DAPPU|nr:hypothetical protein DAPPUDRAFT_325157 [Daphnia pulex]|eukprot:EFX73595.1 hypothetical protein DAPPUDRAFT_325157 [Daphnia pulex]